MTGIREHRDIDTNRFIAGLHLNLDKLGIKKDAAHVEAGGAADEINSVLGVLFIPEFYKHPVPSDQVKTTFDNEATAHVDEITTSAIEEGVSADTNSDQDQIVKQVLNKANDDSDFQLELLENGSAALSQFKLSSEAKAAIASGDVQWVNDNVDNVTESEKAFLYQRLEREAW